MPSLSDLLKPQHAIPIAGGVVDYIQRRRATNKAVGSLRTGATAAQARYEPYAAAGRQGVAGLQALTNPETAQSYLESTPGYQSRLEEGRRQVVRTAAAKRMLNSGGTLKALNRYGQDYASNERARVFGENAAMANMGLGAAANQAQLEQDIAGALASGDFERAGELSRLIGLGVDVAGQVLLGSGTPVAGTPPAGAPPVGTPPVVPPPGTIGRTPPTFPTISSGNIGALGRVIGKKKGGLLGALLGLGG